jgi:hypothetical protein
MAEFRSIFMAKHLIANEIERLMTVLDELNGDPDLELNVDNRDSDPRLEDGEGHNEDPEPSLDAAEADNQVAAWTDSPGYGAEDLEVEDHEDEPSNGALEHVDQRLWAAGSIDDRELATARRPSATAGGLSQ